MKNSIRKIVENFGTVSYPYKSKIDNWYSSISLTKIKPTWDKKKTPYYNLDPMGLRFDILDEAINEFMEQALTSKNKGLIQERLTNKGYDFEDDYDLENPSKELIQLFEDEGKVLDNEYNQTNRPLTHKERINYIRNEEHFVGHPVNINGVVIQAKSLDELKSKAKVLCKMMLDVHYETINQEDPFELVEETDEMIWLYGEQDAKVRKELQKYKDIFGEI